MIQRRRILLRYSTSHRHVCFTDPIHITATSCSQSSQ